MRAVLLFPPQASPTYIPLGLATLAAHARRHLPDLDLAVLDLNIAAWHRLADTDPAEPNAHTFFRSFDGFDNSNAYQKHQIMLHRLDAQLQRLASDAVRYLQTGEAGPDLGHLLDDQVAGVLRTDPELIGISLMFLDQLPLALALARRIAERMASRPRLVLGGAAVSALHCGDLLKACPYVDGLVSGEGEAAWVALCRGDADTQVPGLVFKTNGSYRRNRPSDSLSLRHLPLPEFGDFALDLYFNPEPVLPVVFSRGCIWRRCRFCAHNLSFASYRRKRASEFAGELERLQARTGARHFYLADQYVAATDLEAIASALIERGLEIRFQTMGRPVAGFSRGRLELLARAGCRWISWGVESGSQRLLDIIDKGTRVEMIERVIRDAAQAGISNLLMMVFGLPTSTDDDLDLTLEFLSRLAGCFDALTLSRFVLFERTYFGRNPQRFGLRVIGSEHAVAPGGRAVRTQRLHFNETANDGSPRPPRGSLEVAAARRRLRWQGDVSFLSEMACEHYLLHVARRVDQRGQPLKPSRIA